MDPPKRPVILCVDYPPTFGYPLALRLSMGIPTFVRAAAAAFLSLSIAACATEHDEDTGNAESEVGTTDICAVQKKYGDEICDTNCKKPDPDCDFHIIGHRGAPYAYPENTVGSFEQAIRQRANAIELDLCPTKDNQIVVWHDCNPVDLVAAARFLGFEGLPWVPKYPNLGDGALRRTRELTLEEIQSSRGYGKRSDNGPDPRYEVPSFEDFIDWTKTTTHLTAVYLDIKLADNEEAYVPVMAERIARLTEDKPFTPIFISPHENIIKAFSVWYRRNRPEHRARFALDHEKEGALRDTARLGFDTISMGKTPLRGFDSVLAELTTTVKTRDARADLRKIDRVTVWTLDDAIQISQVIKAGANGVMTNRPRQLAQLVRRGFGDHQKLTKALADCWRAHGGENKTAYCSSTSSLDLYSMMELWQMEDWVCDQSRAPDETQDLFGCGWIFDKTNVRFDAIPGSADDLTIWFDAGDNRVVVSKPAPRK